MCYSYVLLRFCKIFSNISTWKASRLITSYDSIILLIVKKKTLLMVVQKILMYFFKNKYLHINWLEGH